MAFRKNVLTGQMFGRLNWISKCGKEVGMFLHHSRGQTRCVVAGDEVERMVSNGLLRVNSVVTAAGELTGRTFRRGDGVWLAEATIFAKAVTLESAAEGPVQGSLYANLKGVVMHWDFDTEQLKTFINSTDHGRPAQLTCSLYMKNWIAGMGADSARNFKKAMRVGREFTTTTRVHVDCYNSKGVTVPVLQLLPTDFRLQG